MARIPIDPFLLEQIRAEARLRGVTESELVTMAVWAAAMPRAQPVPPPPDPWTPVPVYAEYAGERVTASYLPATGRVVITSAPLADISFKSPSGASSAVVAALNPARAQTARNGWTFWRLVSTDEPLSVLRTRPKRTRGRGRSG